ncbi:MAG: nuclear transport factor 2 family protein, partial [Paracoccaceae bacterium]|nr:nuclear transport factor 2 family protein [Paracoccaceae bacterium]
MTDTARATIQAYFDAFNAGDTAGMLACLADDVAHHVNEGTVRTGKAA